jgi:hypothetical protein
MKQGHDMRSSDPSSPSGTITCMCVCVCVCVTYGMSVLPKRESPEKFEFEGCVKMP